MSFVIEAKYLEGFVVVTPHAYHDERGFFMETYRADHFEKLGLPASFVQDNHSFSRKGVIRGLHFQWDPPMGKLMRVTRGAAFLVAVDIRKGSPTLGKWVGLEVSAESLKQVWAPAGFARGFCALTEEVEVQYKCTAIYNGKAESAIRWDDPEIGIEWPLKDVMLSQKDRNARTLTEWLASPDSEHFLYTQPASLKA
jgi:dTDP-4-dehydrorhamnose 3,5-epimerase